MKIFSYTVKKKKKVVKIIKVDGPRLLRYKGIL